MIKELWLMEDDAWGQAKASEVMEVIPFRRIHNFKGMWD